MQKAKGRILCVEDDKDTRDMMSALLGLEGYEVREARSVAEGLSVAASDSFDLILLDWIFEDGTGIDLCKTLCSDGAHAPILFCSGVGSRAEIETAMRAGAQGFLIKPVDINELLQSITRFVGNDGDYLRAVS